MTRTLLRTASMITALVIAAVFAAPALSAAVSIDATAAALAGVLALPNTAFPATAYPTGLRLFNLGATTLSVSTLTVGGDGLRFEGSLSASGSITVWGCTVTRAAVPNREGALTVTGGAINGRVTIRDSTLSASSAGGSCGHAYCFSAGAAVMLDGGTARVVVECARSTGVSSAYYGYGIAVVNGGPGTSVRLSGGHFHGESTNDGHGVYLHDIGVGSSITAEHLTSVGRVPGGPWCYGFFIDAVQSNTRTVIRNATVSVQAMQRAFAVMYPSVISGSTLLVEDSVLEATATDIAVGGVFFYHGTATGSVVTIRRTRIAVSAAVASAEFPASGVGYRNHAGAQLIGVPRVELVDSHVSLLPGNAVSVAAVDLDGRFDASHVRTLYNTYGTGIDAFGLQNAVALTNGATVCASGLTRPDGTAVSLAAWAALNLQRCVYDINATEHAALDRTFTLPNPMFPRTTYPDGVRVHSVWSTATTVTGLSTTDGVFHLHGDVYSDGSVVLLQCSASRTGTPPSREGALVFSGGRIDGPVTVDGGTFTATGPGAAPSTATHSTGFIAGLLIDVGGGAGPVAVRGVSTRGAADAYFAYGTAVTAAGDGAAVTVVGGDHWGQSVHDGHGVYLFNYGAGVRISVHDANSTARSVGTPARWCYGVMLDTIGQRAVVDVQRLTADVRAKERGYGILFSSVKADSTFSVTDCRLRVVGEVSAVAAVFFYHGVDARARVLIRNATLDLSVAGDDAAFPSGFIAFRQVSTTALVNVPRIELSDSSLNVLPGSLGTVSAIHLHGSMQGSHVRALFNRYAATVAAFATLNTPALSAGSSVCAAGLQRLDGSAVDVSPWVTSLSLGTCIADINATRWADPDGTLALPNARFPRTEYPGGVRVHSVWATRVTVSGLTVPAGTGALHIDGDVHAAGSVEVRGCTATRSATPFRQGALSVTGGRVDGLVRIVGGVYTATGHGGSGGHRTKFVSAISVDFGGGPGKLDITDVTVHLVSSGNYGYGLAVTNTGPGAELNVTDGQFYGESLHDGHGMFFSGIGDSVRLRIVGSYVEGYIRPGGYWAYGIMLDLFGKSADVLVRNLTAKTRAPHRSYGVEFHTIGDDGSFFIEDSTIDAQATGHSACGVFLHYTPGLRTAVHVRNTTISIRATADQGEYPSCGLGVRNIPQLDMAGNSWKLTESTVTLAPGHTAAFGGIAFRPLMTSGAEVRTSLNTYGPSVPAFHTLGVTPSISADSHVCTAGLVRPDGSAVDVSPWVVPLQLGLCFVDINATRWADPDGTLALPNARFPRTEYPGGVRVHSVWATRVTVSGLTVPAGTGALHIDGDVHAAGSVEVRGCTATRSATPFRQGALSVTGGRVDGLVRIVGGVYTATGHGGSGGHRTKFVSGISVDFGGGPGKLDITDVTVHLVSSGNYGYGLAVTNTGPGAELNVTGGQFYGESLHDGHGMFFSGIGDSVRLRIVGSYVEGYIRPGGYWAYGIMLDLFGKSADVLVRNLTAKTRAPHRSYGVEFHTIGDDGSFFIEDSTIDAQATGHSACGVFLHYTPGLRTAVHVRNTTISIRATADQGEYPSCGLGVRNIPQLDMAGNSWKLTESTVTLAPGHTAAFGGIAFRPLMTSGAEVRTSLNTYGPSVPAFHTLGVTPSISADSHVCTAGLVRPDGSAVDVSPWVVPLQLGLCFVDINATRWADPDGTLALPNARFPRTEYPGGVRVHSVWATRVTVSGLTVPAGTGALHIDGDVHAAGSVEVRGCTATRSATPFRQGALSVTGGRVDGLVRIVGGVYTATGHGGSGGHRTKFVSGISVDFGGGPGKLDITDVTVHLVSSGNYGYGLAVTNTGPGAELNVTGGQFYGESLHDGHGMFFSGIGDSVRLRIVGSYVEGYIRPGGYWAYGIMLDLFGKSADVLVRNLTAKTRAPHRSYGVEFHTIGDDGSFFIEDSTIDAQATGHSACGVFLHYTPGLRTAVHVRNTTISIRATADQGEYPSCGLGVRNIPQLDMAGNSWKLTESTVTLAPGHTAAFGGIAFRPLMTSGAEVRASVNTYDPSISAFLTFGMTPSISADSHVCTAGREWFPGCWDHCTEDRLRIPRMHRQIV